MRREFRFSATSSYLQCRRKFWLEYGAKLEKIPGPLPRGGKIASNAELGTAVHAVLEAHYKNKNKKDGFDYQCKSCVAQRGEVWRDKNREKRRKQQREYHRKNKVLRIKKARNRYENGGKVKYKTRAISRRLFPNKKPCIYCGSAETERHHPNYKKPELTIFVCKKHHKNIHDETL